MVSAVESKWWTEDTVANVDKWYEAFHQHFEYDNDTGELYWKIRTSSRVTVGDPAGTINSDGYVQVSLFGRFFKAHRIIWLMTYGVWPAHELDHKKRDRSNNRLDNLRDVTSAVNSANTGHHSDSHAQCKGVAYDPKYAASPWRVQISRNYKVCHRSFHLTYEEACAKAEEIYSTIDD